MFAKSAFSSLTGNGDLLLSFDPFLGVERLRAPPQPSVSDGQKDPNVTKTKDGDGEEEEEDEDEDDVASVGRAPTEPIDAAGRQRSFRHVTIPAHQR